MVMVDWLYTYSPPLSSMIAIYAVRQAVQLLLGLFVQFLGLPLPTADIVDFLHERLPSTLDGDLLGDLQSLEGAECEVRLFQCLSCFVYL